MKKVVVFGSTGFVGSNLNKYLSKCQVEIQSLSLRNSEWKKKLDNSADVIIHLAGKAHDTTNTVEHSEYFKINRDLTIEVFDEFIKSDIKDFFFFSSVKAVADEVEGQLLENHTANPITPYGQSKKAAEDYILSQIIPEGKRVFIIRPCMIHGPGNKGNLNLLYQVVKKGIPWPLAAFDNERSFLSIENLCFLIERMISNSEVKSGIYNFADDNPISTNALISLISAESGRKPKLWRISKGIFKSIAKIGDSLPLPLNSERLKKLTENYVVSNSKIKKSLSISALPLTAEEGLRQTIRSFNKI